MLCDELKEYTNPTYGSSYYDIDEVDAAIAELKDKCQMHDFFWEGCGFAKRGFKNSIAVSEAFDKLEAENAELKAENAELKKKLEDAQATAYAEMVDAGMRERRLRRALWIARAKIAKAMKAVDNLNNYLSLHKNSKWFGIYATRIDTWYYKWDNVERKCRAKAENYK